MKKLLILIFVVLMTFTLAACGNNSNSKQKASVSNKNTQTEKTDSSDMRNKNNNQTQSNTAKNILVAYFSQTGNTRVIANQIHQSVGGDIFEIKTVKPYPTDYKTLVDQAKKEQEENYRPKLATKVDNMNSYDVVFVGYPDWWGTMPMAVFNFLEQYNLSGKTIVPFCTHEGSGLGRSVEDIKKVCSKSTILDGLAVRGKNVKNANNDVVAWLHKIRMIK